MESGQLNVRWDDGREPRSKRHRGQQTCNSHQPSKEMGQRTRHESRWPRHGPEENAHGLGGSAVCCHPPRRRALGTPIEGSSIFLQRFGLTRSWGPPTSMEQARVMGQNGHFSLHHDQSGVHDHDCDSHPCHENSHHQNHSHPNHHQRDVQQQDCRLS